MWKGNIWFFFQQEGEIGSKKTESEAQEKWVKEEGDQENKRSNKNGNGKQCECETWWTKTKSDAKKMQETFDEEEKRMFFMREIFFFLKKNGDFFGP